MTKNPCAVDGCDNPGRPQVCLYDGSYHHHGRIHYECEVSKLTEHGLTFRGGDWHLLCDEHYSILEAAIDRWHETPAGANHLRRPVRTP